MAADFLVTPTLSDCLSQKGSGAAFLLKHLLYLQTFADA